MDEWLKQNWFFAREHNLVRESRGLTKVPNRKADKWCATTLSQQHRFSPLPHNAEQSIVISNNGR